MSHHGHTHSVNVDRYVDGEASCMMRGDTKSAKTWGAFGEAAALRLKPPWRCVQSLIGQSSGTVQAASGDEAAATM